MSYGGCSSDSTWREKLDEHGGRESEMTGPDGMGAERGHSKQSGARDPWWLIELDVKGEGRIQKCFFHFFLDSSPASEGVNAELLKQLLNRAGKSQLILAFDRVSWCAVGLGYHEGSTDTDTHVFPPSTTIKNHNFYSSEVQIFVLQEFPYSQTWLRTSCLKVKKYLGSCLKLNDLEQVPSTFSALVSHLQNGKDDLKNSFKAVNSILLIICPKWQIFL